MDIEGRERRWKQAAQGFIPGVASRGMGRQIKLVADDAGDECGPAAKQALGAVAIASNTGFMSDGEPAITFRMSAVAVCRSSASLVSLNSRVFSIAMTAWSAKVRSSWT